MKQTYLLRTLTIILIIILLSMISFIGVYQLKLNKYENVIPEYKTGMEFGDRRSIILAVDNSTQTVYYDADGNIVEHTHEEGEEHSEDEELLEGQTAIEEPVNDSNNLTEENYQLSKSIILKRLKDVEVSEYNVKKAQDGSLTVDIPEDTNTSTYVELISASGVFELLDSDTNEILMNNDDVQTSSVLYNTTDTGTSVYLNIEFKKESRSKLEEISKTYVESQDEEGNDTTKNVTLQLDNEILATTYFGQTMSDGLLQLPIGSDITTQEELLDSITQATVISTIIKNGNLPIQYSVDYNNTISTNITQNDIKIATVIAIIAVGLMIIYMIIRNDINGLTLGMSLVGFIAIVLLITRYTDCVLTINAIAGLIIVVLFEYMFLLSYLKKIRQNNIGDDAFKETYLQYLKLGIPVLIIAIIFTFSSLTIINSFGMILFWGIAVFLLYNLVTIKYLTINKKR